MSSTPARQAAEAIARAAIAAVDPERIITESLSLEGDTLRVRAGSESFTFDLTTFDRIVAVGGGKASAAMARGLERILGERIEGGTIAVKYGHTAELERCTLIEAGHPVPDDQSVRAASTVAQIAREADERTLVIALVSGGGSALLTLPAEDGGEPLTLDDLQATTSLLLGAGVTIQKMNTVRKHLSALAGGRFCALAAPATVLALVLSDVVGDDLGSIASGLTAPDPSTFGEALAICRDRGIEDRLPPRVRSYLQDGEAGTIGETPKPGDAIFEQVHVALVGSNRLALEAARESASAMGYRPLVLTSQLTGEAREIAHLFAAMARELAAGHGVVDRPACILAGGETTVTLRGDGKGGRNQEMALAVLAEIADEPARYEGITFLSAGTDGNDGPTDAAGAFADSELAAGRVESAAAALARNDAYPFFDEIGGLLRTGATNTNVCDIQILIAEEPLRA